MQNSANALAPALVAREEFYFARLPNELQKNILLKSIKGITNGAAVGKQVATLRTVSKNFNANVQIVLQQPDLSQENLARTAANIEALTKQVPIEEYPNRFRAMLRDARDVRVRLTALPEVYRQPTLEVLQEQTHLRIFELDASQIDGPITSILNTLQEILQKNNQLSHTALALRDCGLGPWDIDMLAQLANMPSLTNLDLEGNRIGAEGANILAENVSLRSLKSLNLGHNFNIGDEGAKALAESAHLGSLTNLCLSYNGIGPAGAQALAESAHLGSLTSLCLSYNGIGPAGAQALAESAHLRSLTNLRLDYNEIGAAGARALAESEHLRSLTHFFIAHNRLGEEGAKALAESENLRSLTTLDLRNNSIGDEGVKALAESENLQQLININLFGNNISAAGLAALVHFKLRESLTNLDLSGFSIGDEGAKALAESVHLKSLTSLDLERNSIGDDGATALAESAHLRSLTSLRLDRNGIGAAGAKALAESEHLRSLTHFFIAHNRLGEEGAMALAASERMKSWIRLDLMWNKIGDEGAKALAESENLKSVTHLDLINNNIGDEGAKALAESENLQSLTGLYLRHNKIGPEGARKLAQSVYLPSLTRLVLTFNKIGNEGAQALVESAHLESLENLAISGNNITSITDDDIRLLENGGVQQYRARLGRPPQEPALPAPPAPLRFARSASPICRIPTPANTIRRILTPPPPVVQTPQVDEFGMTAEEHEQALQLQAMWELQASLALSDTASEVSVEVEPAASAIPRRASGNWRFDEAEDSAADFNEFQGRLSGTAAYGNSATRVAFVDRVNDLVAAMDASAELRGLCFVIAKQVSCGDGVVLQLHKMERARFDCDVTEGVQTLADLYSVGRRVFALDAVNTIANRRIQTLEARGVRIDQAEIELAYQTELAAPLNLPVIAQSMLYRGAANVSQRHLNEAEREVRRQLEGSAPINFLVSWGPWQRAIEREHPEAFASLRAMHERRRNALVNAPSYMNSQEYKVATDSIGPRESEESTAEVMTATLEFLEENPTA